MSSLHYGPKLRQLLLKLESDRDRGPSAGSERLSKLAFLGLLVVKNAKQRRRSSTSSLSSSPTLYSPNQRSRTSSDTPPGPLFAFRTQPKRSWQDKYNSFETGLLANLESMVGGAAPKPVEGVFHYHFDKPKEPHSQARQAQQTDPNGGAGDAGAFAQRQERAAARGCDAGTRKARVSVHREVPDVSGAGRLRQRAGSEPDAGLLKTPAAEAGGAARGPGQLDHRRVPAKQGRGRRGQDRGTARGDGATVFITTCFTIV
ncbi:hypothetical protein KL910_000219 [Ogataea haglerorum]|nr:hypothetical protein KL947_000323 [Ogataea haglerorum]KAG7791208.1 hypothetical protein KL945_000996 [Ogataea haglerorum]KAG7793524.1 hypothetical protein KL910_000219 [Ogataea haglerorum]